MPQPCEGKERPGTVALEQAIQDELCSVRNCRQLLAESGQSLPIHGVVLFICILINALFFLVRLDYFALFIAASIYLNMFYFISLLIPTSRSSTQLRKGSLKKSRAWLQEMGIKASTTQFTRVFLNAFFINSRALSLGIGAIFSIDILFTLIDYYFLHVDSFATALTIVQCAAIAIFYLLVWKVEPFTAAFRKNVEGVKGRLSDNRIPRYMVSALFMFAFVFGLILIIATIILLPGMTVSTFMTAAGLAELGHMVGLIVILAVSQYFIIRAIHGTSSRLMAARLLDYKENTLRNLMETEPASNSSPPRSPSEVTSLLLESRIYQVRQHSLLGTFPVWVVDLDLSVMLDTTTMTAIKGYIRENRE